MKKIFRIGLIALLCIAFVSCSKAPVIEESPTVVEPGKVRGKVLTTDGNMTTAGIIVIDEANNARRVMTNAYGGYTLVLDPGDYTLIYTKGPEFSTYTTKISVSGFKTYYRPDVRLEQVVDSYALGWIPGDPHQHSYYSDGIDGIQEMTIGNAAAGLYWGFLTDHNTSRGVPEWRESNVNVLTQADGQTRDFQGYAGVEVTTEFGHIQSLGTGIVFDRYEINFTEEERAKNAEAKKKIARDKILYIAEQIEWQGGVAQVNHPYSLTNMGVANFVAPDDYELYSAFSTMEIWNGYFTVPDGRFTDATTDNQNYTAKMLWYSLLNAYRNGEMKNFIAATGGTDNHDISGAVSAANRNKIVDEPKTAGEYFSLCRYSGQYNGVPTTYVYVDGDITEGKVLSALSNGNTFISNGPVLNCTIGGAIYGETITAEQGQVVIDNDIFNRDGIYEVRVVKNGEIAKSVTLAGEQTYTDDITVDVQKGDWVLIEVLGSWGSYAISNPVFID